MSDFTVRQACEALTLRMTGIVEQAQQTTLSLIAFLLNETKAWVISHDEDQLSTEQKADLDKFCERLIAGEPLPYITGKQEFYGLPFKVTPNVLIPRPETELLVFQAVKWLKSHPSALKVLDLGTGSACISVSIASQLPQISIDAVDISDEVLMVARENAIQNGCSKRIRFIHSDLFGNLDSHYNLILANLPYIPSSEVEAVNSAPYEPRLALDGGPDGFSLIERAFIDAREHLLHPWMQMFEFQSNLGVQIKALAKKYYPYSNLTIFRDLSGLERLLLIEEEKPHA